MDGEVRERGIWDDPKLFVLAESAFIKYGKYERRNYVQGRGNCHICSLNISKLKITCGRVSFVGL